MLPARALFFDLDDTLVDFGKARRRALQRVVGELAARLPHRSGGTVLEARARIVAERARRGVSVRQNADINRVRARIWAEVLEALDAGDLTSLAELPDLFP